MQYLPADVNPIEAKALFAAALLRYPHDPFKAATMVYPKHMQACLWVMQEWPHDPYVLETQAKLIEDHGQDAFLPTQQELAHELYHTATKATMTEDKLKAFELYAKVRGFINKPAEPANVNVSLTNKVLVVREASEGDVKARQAQLMRDMAEDAN